jgi:hypothetical protein
MQSGERNQIDAMAMQCSTSPWKPDARTVEREVLQAEVSEASARQCDEVQFKRK